MPTWNSPLPVRKLQKWYVGLVISPASHPFVATLSVDLILLYLSLSMPAHILDKAVDCK